MSLPQVCKPRTRPPLKSLHHHMMRAKVLAMAIKKKKRKMPYTEETTCAVATILRLRNFGVNQVYKSQISIVKRYRSRRFER